MEMRRGEVLPLSLHRIKTYSVRERRHKAKIKDFAVPSLPGTSFSQFWDSLPRILKAQDLRNIEEEIVSAYRRGKEVVFALGDSIIKVGLSPIIIHLMEKGVITALAFQGAGMIHDTEIALIGETSEDVAEGIKDGSFGMAQETGEILNRAIRQGARDGLGVGEAVGRYLTQISPPYKGQSISIRAYELGLPVTVHIAIGTDTIHIHPDVDGEAVGKASHIDFRKFCSIVSRLEEGVLVNIASAVILPEVFLKVLSVVRNLGFKVHNFTTVNLDMLMHYRPMENVVKRPTATGGKGYSIIGHNEIIVPLLARAVLEKIEG